MRGVNVALASAWVLVLAGVGMRWPALSWGAAAGFGVLAVAWAVMFSRLRPP